MKKILTIVLLITLFASLKAQQPIVEVEQQNVVAKTTLAPQLAGSLMSSAYMTSGSIFKRDGNVVIYGNAYIDLPIDQVSQIVTLPTNYTAADITGGSFNRTTNGFEITLNLTKTVTVNSEIDTNTPPVN